MSDRLRPEDYRSAAELREALRSFLRQSEQVARRHKLTPQRYLLLLMIKGAPDGSERATVTELAERLQLAQSTVTELVNRAEGVGLVRREPSREDGRVAYLRLTPEAERRLSGAISDLGPERRRLSRVLGPSSRR
jgi:MarR family 2-MHQ and catechol resistance regulon transcriptional repressor